jgi:hypothetical protein
MKEREFYWWKVVSLTRGRHAGQTVYWVYVNDQTYLCSGEYANEVSNPLEVVAITNALRYKADVDPCYDDAALAGGFRD